VVDLAAAGDLDFEPFAERVHHRHAHPMQTTRHFVRAAAELAARMQHGHRDFDAGAFLDGVLVDGDPTAVVGDGDGIVCVEHAVDLRAVPGHHLVDAVVHYFDKEVMQTAHACRANVHRGTTAYGFEAFEDLNVFRLVVSGRRLAALLGQVRLLTSTESECSKHRC